ncbi:hypothetical protein NLJ89_g11670 [Agrocybe chaxingu]|uniref:Uncharacterized protein n=1 Tax=Agrocybe chaxingu TaxID=84603 RepID=A0A9W8JVV9_9AGAR|nr:hypothetical protein NLJ89_g11670 [Agrocybe chaxingu]
MFYFSASAFLASIVALPAVVLAQWPNMGPTGFNITRVDVAGNGCTPESTSYVMNADKNAITAVFSNGYWVETGLGIALNQTRRGCRLTLNTEMPHGWRFGLLSVDYTTYYRLDAKITADQQATYYFKGVLEQGTTRSTFIGPMAPREYTFHDQYDFGFPIESPCNTTSVVWYMQSDIRVGNARNAEGTGRIGSDTWSGVGQPPDTQTGISKHYRIVSLAQLYSQTYNLYWVKC